MAGRKPSPTVGYEDVEVFAEFFRLPVQVYGSFHEAPKFEEFRISASFLNSGVHRVVAYRFAQSPDVLELLSGKKAQRALNVVGTARIRKSQLSVPESEFQPVRHYDSSVHLPRVVTLPSFDVFAVLRVVLGERVEGFENRIG